jgi:hypothetical protein
MTVLVLLGAAACIGLFYARYYANLKKAGGRAAAGAIYWREQFALDPDEEVVAMAIGTWYLGPLVPETMRSTAEKVLDALSRTSYRGAHMWIAFTTKNRLALAVEPTEEGPRPARSSIGMPSSYAPLAIFGAELRPWIERSEEAWPGSPHLPSDRQKPVRANSFGQMTRQDLIRITSHDGRQMTFFVEDDWVAPLQGWARGGPPRIDPRWVAPARSAA